MPPYRRPPSPFLILLASASIAALGAEWLRFQWGWTLAALPAVAGGAWSLWCTARAFRARRRWRRAWTDRTELEAGVTAGAGTDEAPQTVRARPAGPAEAAGAPAAAPAPDPARDAVRNARDTETDAERSAAEDTVAER